MFDMIKSAYDSVVETVEEVCDYVVETYNDVVEAAEPTANTVVKTAKAVVCVSIIVVWEGCKRLLKFAGKCLVNADKSFRDWANWGKFAISGVSMIIALLLMGAAVANWPLFLLFSVFWIYYGMLVNFAINAVYDSFVEA